MTTITEDQICQAFDPIMVLPEKTYRIIKDHMKANTSCFAPASVFIDGAHGTRYLCDYHYQNEKDITMVRTPHLWQSIAQTVVDEREKIKDTFSKNTTSNETENNYCWCKQQAFVKIINKNTKGLSFFCNFHFRKFYYRNYSNYVIFENEYEIIDERYRMQQSVIEQAESVTIY